MLYHWFTDNSLLKFGNYVNLVLIISITHKTDLLYEEHINTFGQPGRYLVNHFI